MMTEELINCPECKYDKALTHYSSCNTVNWIACPKCKSYFEWGEKVEADNRHDKDFWNHVEKDTGWTKSN